MHHEAYGHSAIGKCKKENQDAFLIDAELGLYIVCDGIGGRKAGNVASTTACTLMRQYLVEHIDVLKAYANKPTTTHRHQASMVVRSVVNMVNSEIHKMGMKNPKLQGMASTFVMVLVMGQNVIVAHAGDSRAYLIRGDRSYVLTDDHSVVKRQLKRGLITAEDALHGSQSSTVTRAIGMNEYLEPETLNVELTPGDMFLLCTDGLSRYVTTEEIARATVTFAWEETPEKLVRLADKRAGKDNITALIVAVDPKQTVKGLDAGQKIDALRMIPLFESLSYHESIRVLSVVSSRSYKKGDQIIAQGQDGREFFVGVTGNFIVEMEGQQLAKLSAGSIFGEMMLLTESPHQVDVFATEDSMVLVIDRDDFFGLLRSDPYLGNKLLWSFSKMLAERLVRTGKQFAKLKLKVGGLTNQKRSDLAKHTRSTGQVNKAARGQNPTPRQKIRG